nr:hypothetical protein [Tanacetum cinerariifolium]
MYDSWTIRICLFIKGKKHDRMMLDSINNGSLVYPTVEENRQTRPKNYSNYSESQQLQDDCDVQATNIIRHGLPPDVYALVNHQEAAKDIWDRVKMLMKGTELSYQERECILYGLFDKFAHVPDPGISEAPVAHQKIPHNSAFQTDDLDADDLSLAKVVLMANLLSCDPEVLSEVPYSDSYPNDMINQDVENSGENLNAPMFNQLFEINELKAQSQAKDTVIRKLKEIIKYLSEKDSVEKVKKDIDDIETINIELEHSVAKLLSKNENLRKEREHLKSIIKDQFDSIGKIHSNAQLQEKVFAITTLKNALRKLKGKNVVNTVVLKPNAIIALGMFKHDIEPISARLKNNRDAHEELLVYASQTCPNSPKPSEKLVVVTLSNKDKRVRFDKPVTSLNNIPKHANSLKTKDSNKPLLTSIGVKPTTSASESKPSELILIFRLKVEISQDVLTVGSTMRILLLYRGEYYQWVERFMNYLEEQTYGEAMINSIKNGDQPLPRVTQVSIAGTTSTEQPPLKDKSMWFDQEKSVQKIDHLARCILIQGLPNDIYSLIDSNKTAKDLWDALARH